MDYKTALIAIQAILETCDEKDRAKVVSSFKQPLKRPIKMTYEYALQDVLNYI